MIEPPTVVAHRLRRNARDNRLAERFWAGWKLSLTYGPIAEALGSEATAWSRETASELLGQSWTETDTKQAAEHERDLWHLSVSWRGTYPVADGKRALEELIVALRVPEDKRAGHQPIRVLGSPQVTHWWWRDK